MCASWTSGLSGYLSIKAAAPLAVLALVAAGCSTSEPTSTPTITTTGGTEAATVSRVSDGDTLRTTSGRKIRLVQIDAPELHGDCFGKGALAALRKLTPPGPDHARARPDARFDGQVRAPAPIRLRGRDKHQRRPRAPGRGIAVFLSR